MLVAIKEEPDVAGSVTVLIAKIVGVVPGAAGNVVEVAGGEATVL